MTLVQGLPTTTNFKVILVAWRRWGTSVVQKRMRLPGNEGEGELPALILAGDHRGKVAHWLVSNGTCVREELTIHGPAVTDSPTEPAAAAPIGTTTPSAAEAAATAYGSYNSGGDDDDDDDDGGWDSGGWDDEAPTQVNGSAKVESASTTLPPTTPLPPPAPAATSASASASKLSLLTRTMRGDAPMPGRAAAEPFFETCFSTLFPPKQKSKAELAKEAKARATTKATAEAKAAWKAAKAEEAAKHAAEVAPITALTLAQVEEWRSLERERKPWADTADTEAILFGMALKKFRKTLTSEGQKAVKRGWDAWQLAHENCFAAASIDDDDDDGNGTNDGDSEDSEGGVEVSPFRVLARANDGAVDSEAAAAASSSFVAPVPKAGEATIGMDLLACTAAAASSHPFPLSKKERKRLKREASKAVADATDADADASIQAFFAAARNSGRNGGLPTRPRHGESGGGGSGGGGGVVVLDESRLPRHPPYTAFVGNLPYNADHQEVENTVRNFFGAVGARCTRFRSPRDGFGYAEFNTIDELKLALGASGGRILLSGNQSAMLRIDQAEGNNSSSSRSSSWRRPGRQVQDGFGSSNSRQPPFETRHRSAYAADAAPAPAPTPSLEATATVHMPVHMPRRSVRTMSPSPAVANDGSQASQLGTPASLKVPRCTSCTRALSPDSDGRICSRCSTPHASASSAASEAGSWRTLTPSPASTAGENEDGGRRMYKPPPSSSLSRSGFRQKRQPRDTDVPSPWRSTSNGGRSSGFSG